MANKLKARGFRSGINSRRNTLSIDTILSHITTKAIVQYNKSNNSCLLQRILVISKNISAQVVSKLNSRKNLDEHDIGLYVQQACMNFLNQLKLEKQGIKVGSYNFITVYHLTMPEGKPQLLIPTENGIITAEKYLNNQKATQNTIETKKQPPPPSYYHPSDGPRGFGNQSLSTRYKPTYLRAANRV
ncbi:MAG: hypothetical protein OXR68_05340 [Alphaproteobacteria bacterium]|nr:hypothetical protein [Alphaproteobacteria bacterium]MDD9920027.1 hypothetical protein [Alphaproteobacteria bacterium]